jgi:hypothetical protein
VGYVVATLMQIGITFLKFTTGIAHKSLFLAGLPLGNERDKNIL